MSGRNVLGRGAGGDRTLHIDDACERAMLKKLEALAPEPWSLVSEEAGLVERQGTACRVLVDPLDGSLNAKRGLAPFGASIAVAHGESLADVSVGYVEDYTRPWRFAAVRGAGAVVSGRHGKSTAVDHSTEDRPDVVEVMLLELGSPSRYEFAVEELALLASEEHESDLRIRQVGSLALSLCYVAAGLADVLVALVRSRAVDIAAGLLILVEAGGGAAPLGRLDLWDAPLDLERRSAFVAWRPGLDASKMQERVGKLYQKLAL
ncbi:MAG: hypothetical protein N3B14_09455 [Thermoleophilia bacterium]|nr:hypothetical protein [Thermoleophilia bacterium]